MSAPSPGKRLSRREYAVWRRCQEYGIPYQRVARKPVFDRDRWICQLCQEPVNPALKFPNPGSASLDHIIPLKRGGLHALSNVQLAHLGCNSKKGAK